MSTLILILVSTWLALAVLFWAGSVFLQTYLYSEADANLHWWAPTAGTIVALWVILWCIMAYRSPETYDTLLRFSANEVIEFDTIWTERDGKMVRYEKDIIYQPNRPNRTIFRESDPPYRPWQRSGVIIVEENGEKVRFEAERDADGNYKVETGQPLKYIDKKGRVMTEDAIGKVSVFRWSIFLLNMLLNWMLFVIAFLSLWLMARFQWLHALGLSAVLWLVMIVSVMPMLIDTANALGKEARRLAEISKPAAEPEN
ncbi:MAG: hypothetical protein KatS3mg105_2702 [Gemmatales bacterium]|nr:MAG: hypothetical protein KatS3mg105_2702 [Gemmatales bacterium]